MKDFEQMLWVLAHEQSPERGQMVLCYCPRWNESGYQVATWNGFDYVYDEQSNEQFGRLVISWLEFPEAE